MNLAPPIARVAFVVHLEAPTTLAPDVARIEHVVHLFRGHHVRATWVVAAGKNYELLRKRGMLCQTDELALAISATETGAEGFRETLRRRLNTKLVSQSVSMVAGSPSTFRSHAAFLSEQGLRGVLSNSLKRRGMPSCSPMPCGLWQLDHALTIPGRSLFANLLPESNAARRLHKLIAAEKTVTILVDAARIAQTSSRSLQHLENLVRSVAHLASNGEISLTTAGQIVGELCSQRVARPQHSILRAA